MTLNDVGLFLNQHPFLGAIAFFVFILTFMSPWLVPLVRKILTTREHKNRNHLIDLVKSHPVAQSMRSFISIGLADRTLSSPAEKATYIIMYHKLTIFADEIEKLIDQYPFDDIIQRHLDLMVRCNDYLSKKCISIVGETYYAFFLKRHKVVIDTTLGLIRDASDLSSHDIMLTCLDVWANAFRLTICYYKDYIFDSRSLDENLLDQEIRRLNLSMS